MDTLGIAIIVISVVLAVLFKFVVMKWIRGWVDRDLINSLSGGDAERLSQLNALDNRLKAEGASRAERHHALEKEAAALRAVDTE